MRSVLQLSNENMHRTCRPNSTPVSAMIYIATFVISTECNNLDTQLNPEYIQYKWHMNNQIQKWSHP